MKCLTRRIEVVKAIGRTTTAARLTDSTTRAAATMARSTSSEMAGHGKVSVGAWVGIGMTAGAAFGVAIENIALGVGVGAAIGLAVGYLLRWWKSG